MKTERTPLRFKGAPPRLLATMAAPDGWAKTGLVVLLGKEPMPLTIRRVQSTASCLSLLSFRLPKSTRPGHYAGRVEVGGTRIPMVADVEARPRVRFLPPKVSFQGGPSARRQAEITVLNLGNVDVTIQPESTFCIFDGHGIDRALFEALTQKEAEGTRRIDRVIDGIAESHGGLVRAVVQQGAGELTPEAFRDLVVEFRFSPRLRAGQTYRGAWSISEASLEVEVEATNAVDGVTE